MKRTTLFCLAAGLLMLSGLVSCRSEYDQILESNDIDAKYNAAFNYFNAGKYTRSTALFESLTMLTNGTDRHDTVLYYLGLSNYSYQDYYTAETNFDTYLSYYPQGGSRRTSEDLWVTPDDAFAREIEEIVGKGNYKS